MENAAKALEIAAGVLLGVLLFALVAYFFSSIGSRPEDEDRSLSAEQLAKFNLEYEVYNKKAMYGVDVISCLNKAKSNNMKYGDGEAFLTGQKYGDKYKINVFVTINSALTERVEVHYIDSGKEHPYAIGDASNGIGKIPTMEEAGFDFKKNNNATKYSPSDPLIPMPDINELSDFMVPGEQYSLQGGNSKLIQLLEYSDGDSFLKQIVYNYTGKDLDVWNSAIWETALYDFKKKRFKCEGIEYDGDTGRVNKITFSEI